MPRGYFFAFPPETNSGRLLGPGPAHLHITAAAYAKTAAALNLAADGSDGSTNEMSVTWEGVTSHAAQAAFRRHADWLRKQAELAAEAAVVAEGGAAAYRAAMAAMPPLPLIIANRIHAVELAAEATLTTSTGLGAFTAAKIMANETAYVEMWVRAAATMVAYDAAATGLIATLGSLQPLPPPPITSVGGGEAPRAPGISDGSAPGPPGDGFATGPDGPGPGTGELVQPATEMTPNPVAEQGLPQLEQPLPPMNDVPAQPGAGDPQYGMPEQQGFYGTSPHSPTLAGLSGGMGSMVGLGMISGGLGSMSGAATGFRMPGNWSPAAGRAFGAGTGTAPISTAGAPRREVSAPSSRMRSRPTDDQNKPAKVFAPGDRHDVPELERPPEIGVIEYVDDTDREDEAAPEAFLVGVLERFDRTDTENHEDPRRDRPRR